MYEKVIELTENHSFPSSGFAIVGCRYMDLIVSRSYFARLGGHYIPTPSQTACRNATINQKNLDDEQCFMWAVIASLHKHEISAHPERISVLKKHIYNHNWEFNDCGRACHWVGTE